MGSYFSDSFFQNMDFQRVDRRVVEESMEIGKLAWVGHSVSTSVSEPNGVQISIA